ncbi:MAG: hypothetical protein HZA32_18760 [Opitutae bacterium]|nr:hypothetical protein [Opitutae bacterium]
MLSIGFGGRGMLVSASLWVGVAWWFFALLVVDPRAVTAALGLPRSEFHRLARWRRASVFSVVLAVWMFSGGAISPVLSAGAAVLAGLILRGLIVAGIAQDRRVAPEVARIVVVTGAALLLIHPYFTARLVGAGDAEHYGRAMADFLAQVRGGIFPVWVGQSITAFHGGVHPLRVAPYFQHLGGLLDLATGRTLSPIAVQNLVVVGSLLAAALSAYAALSSLAGRQRWSATWLAVLFVSSPGVLALVYAGDMLASWVALPWLPWLFWGWAKAWRRPESVAGPCAQALALALLWLAHAPIALWASLLTAGVEIARWAAQGFRRETLLRQAGAALLCMMLCQYVFVSVATLDVPANPYLGFELARGAVYDSIVAAWDGLWRSVSPAGADLVHDLHLAPGLLLAGAAALGLAWRNDGAGRACALAGGGLFLLLVPWPGVTDRFWSSMPVFLMTVSEKWPAQRIYPILSALIPIATVLALARVRTSRAQHLCTGLLALGALASTWESRHFLARGHRATRTEAATRRFLLPENATLSRYSYEMWGYLPDHFSFGYMDAENQNRLINPVTGDVRVSNQRFMQQAAARERALRFVAVPHGAQLAGTITLPPRSTVCVRFRFHDPGAEGTLVFTGSRIARRFDLPVSGGPRAFGPGPRQTKSTMLRNESNTPEEVRVEFFSRSNTPVPDFAAVQSLVVQREHLPVRLTGLTPFALALNLPSEGWLETPKLYLRDYRVTVDGRAVTAARSPNGLLMFPVPAGASSIRLTYAAPPLLQISFWTTAAAWLLVAAAALASVRVSHSRVARATANGSQPASARRFAAAALVLGVGCTVWATNRWNEDSAPHVTNAVPVTLRATFPVGRHEVYETLLSWRDEAGATMAVVAFYQDDRHVRIGCRKGGILKILSDPLPVSYFVPHRITVRFDTSASPRLRVDFNDHPLWETDCAQSTAAGWTFGYGRDLDPKFADGNPFRGRLSSDSPPR